MDHLIVRAHGGDGRIRDLLAVKADKRAQLFLAAKSRRAHRETAALVSVGMSGRIFDVHIRLKLIARHQVSFMRIDHLYKIVTDFYIDLCCIRVLIDDKIQFIALCLIVESGSFRIKGDIRLFIRCRILGEHGRRYRTDCQQERHGQSRCSFYIVHVFLLPFLM